MAEREYKFKIGDEVRSIAGVCEGKEGVIADIDENDHNVPFGVVFSDGTASWKKEENLELITEQPTDSASKMRVFDSGATRDSTADKFDYEGFLSPLVLKRYAAYMHQHRKQADGKLRNSDNWQKGIPFDAYMKSGWRHFMDWWMEHRGHASGEGLEEALCAVLFNASGYLHEVLKEGYDKCRSLEDVR